MPGLSRHAARRSDRSRYVNASFVSAGSHPGRRAAARARRARRSARSWRARSSMRDGIAFCVALVADRAHHRGAQVLEAASPQTPGRRARCARDRRHLRPLAAQAARLEQQLLPSRRRRSPRPARSPARTPARPRGGCGSRHRTRPRTRSGSRPGSGPAGGRSRTRVPSARAGKRRGWSRSARRRGRAAPPPGARAHRCRSSRCAERERRPPTIRDGARG